MKNYINVDKYIQKSKFSGYFITRYDEIDFENYETIIDWLATEISPPMQSYDRLFDGVQIARCGKGWSFHKMAIPGDDPDMESTYQWCVVIDDPNLAVAFKLTWP